ncbi:hypothetical protein OKW34_003588 [Paraburkholderia youngii]|uniref:hypothetical protein n=1 Tax=Paraburkholderia youngii TaxID=2782701 RepID=UPI003D19D6A3
MLQSLPEQILSELRHLLGEMSDGGSVGPSIYDTALNLHFQADSSEQREAYRWLLAQQHADGGWGSPDFPLFRHALTLAASHRADHFPEGADAVRAAHAFLLRQPAPYLHAVPEEAPIGVELILPQLCDEAGSLLAELAMPRCARCGNPV